MRYLRFLFAACGIVGLAACGGSAQPEPRALILQAAQPVAGVEIRLSRSSSQALSLNAVAFDTSELGLGADVVTESRQESNGDVSFAAYSQGAPAVTNLRLLTLPGGAALPLVTRLRCADQVGNPVDCQAQWE